MCWKVHHICKLCGSKNVLPDLDKVYVSGKLAWAVDLCICYSVYPKKKKKKILIWVYPYLLLYVACLSIPLPSLAKCKRLAGISVHKLKDCAYNNLK